ncbi:TolC family protein [Capnocytophaga granulosa]|uniref:TolC family protein n=1 Tax=Capnocytophaga granulosa TaxID=45242 RepID=UPI0028F0B5B7|nr:TolC family protein [Capnocytophaga granulosa]
MKYKILFASLLSLPMWGQQKLWSLTDCINYAVNNNITVKKTQLGQQTAAINLDQAKNNRLPAVSGNISANANHGSVINQITNNRVNQTTITNSMGVSASMPLYEGNKLNLQIERATLALEQNDLYVKEAQNNITLSVLEAYLQALYQYENIAVAKNTALSSEEQLAQAQQKYENGAIAKIDLIEIETQHANNEYNVVLAKNQYENQVLTLKQLLELPPGTEFGIEIIQKEDVSAPIANKEEIYRQALEQLPTTKIYEKQKELAQKDIQIAKSGFLPSLSLSGGINTGYSDRDTEKYMAQLKNNFGQTIGLSLNIPIFSRYQNKNNVALARLSESQADLDRKQAEKDLYTKIETAWHNATTRQAQEVASKKARDNAKLAYELAEKKHEFGNLTNTELLVSRNTYLNAEQTYLQNKYMVLLYQQLLNFYQGKEITIND